MALENLERKVGKDAADAARKRCFEKCSKGYFIDPENGCVGTCDRWEECTTWEWFLINREVENG